MEKFMLENTTAISLDVKDYAVILSINAALTAIIVFIAELIKHFIQKSIEAKFNIELEDIKRVQNQILEEYKFDMKKREQAVKIAEYLALAKKHLSRTDNNATDYNGEKAKLNQMSLEMCLWLPDNDIKLLNKVFRGNGDAKEALISIRKFLHGKNDRLVKTDIIVFN